MINRLLLTHNRLFSATCVVVIIAISTPLLAAEIEFKPELRVCAKGGATVVKGGSCWIMDLKTAKDRYEYELCIGLVVEGGILIAGGEASVMLCGTLVVPAELAKTSEDKDAWKKVAEKRVREYITDPSNADKIKKATGKFDRVDIKAFGRPDADVKVKNKKAIGTSTPLP